VGDKTIQITRTASLAGRGTLRGATLIAGGIAGVLVVLLGAIAAGTLVVALAAKRTAILLDHSIGLSGRPRLPDEIRGVATPDLPE
jgi:hypothetical protein